MIAKTQFSKDQIIEAAFEIAREDGLDSITVRKVSERLGSSIAPIYVNFKSVAELAQAVIQKIIAVSQELISEQNTGNPFYDIGAASLRFANEHPQLFRDLVLRPNPYLQSYNQSMGPVLLEQMKIDPALAGFSEEELTEILLKMQIFQLGLSVMIANRLLPGDFDEGQSIQLLNRTADDLIAGIRLRNRK